MDLKIRSIRFEGERWSYASPEFEDGLNIVSGDNGTGKTTFTDLIYYCLGGTPKQLHPKGARHAELATEKNAYVDLAIEIATVPYRLRRHLYTTEVSVSEPGGAQTRTLPIHRLASGGSKGTFSDWMLTKLGFPEVEIPQGDRTWRLAFTDYARLIYHNQLSDPSVIYRPPEIESHVSDSLYVRKTIFSTLTGSATPALHKANAELFRLEKTFRDARGELSAFRGASSILFGGSDRDAVNSEFLREQLGELQDRLELVETRLREFEGRSETPDDFVAEINEVKEKVYSAESDLHSAENDLRHGLLLRRDLIETSRLLKLEVDQLSKILATSETLNLFGADTCPFCLEAIVREEGQCICGAKVDDEVYQSALYAPKDYIDLLRRRRRNLETVESALVKKQEEVEGTTSRIGDLEKGLHEARSRLRELLSERKDMRALPRRLVILQNRRVELEAQAEAVNRKLEVETHRQRLESKVNRLSDELEEQRILVRQLEAEADKALLATKREFGNWYSGIIVKTSPNVRDARLSDTLLPVLNNREYLEASAMVPFRLLYYGAMLHLSVNRNDILFPRFLLVDTPQTAGIDPDNLVRLYDNWFKTLDHVPIEAWQVILTTKEETVPNTRRGNIVEKLTHERRLLVQKPTSNS